MIKTTLPNRRAVAQIVREYRKLAGSRARPATLRAFAAALSQALRAQGRGVSYQSVKNWQDGRYLPDAYGMLCLARAARLDWRGEFASDVLAALHPESHRPATEIGRQALEQHRDAAALRGKHAQTKQPSYPSPGHAA